jgi:hypothetical protein
MIAHTLPEEGLDLRQELLACQTHLVEQALLRTNGDRTRAAQLLRTDPLSLERLKRFLSPAPVPTPASELPTRTDLTRPRPYRDCRAPSVPASAKAGAGELGRIDGGVLKITRAVIRRLATEGLTAKQIGTQLGVNFYFIEKVLRAEAEQLAKCGSKREPPK